MKCTKILLFTFIILLSLVSCTSLGDQSQEVFGGDYLLKSNETLNGDLVFFGGKGVLEDGSVVKGDLLVAGGSVDVNGEIKGDVSVLNGSVFLGDTAEVKGNVSSIGGRIDRDENANVKGGIISTGADLPWLDNSGLHFPIELFSDLGSQLEIPFNLFLVLLWTGFGALMVLIFPRSIDRMSQAIINQPMACTGIGLLTVIIGFAATFTILLIPVICLFSPIFVAVWVFGKIGLGLAIGRKIEPAFSSSMSPVVMAGIGIFLVELASMFMGWIPCVGWLGGFFLSLIGLGSAVVTVFGTRDYPRIPRNQPERKENAQSIDVQAISLEENET